MNKTLSHYDLYFLIKGNFDVEEIIKNIDLPIFEIIKEGEYRRDGTKYNFSQISISKIESEEPYIYLKLESLVDILSPRKDYLKLIKDKYHLDYSIVVVPYIYLNSIYPSLSPSLKVMDFCSEMRINLDIDLYLYK